MKKTRYFEKIPVFVSLNLASIQYIVSTSINGALYKHGRCTISSTSRSTFEISSV